MNRQKKLNEIFQKRLKRAKAKLHTGNKPAYVSKAERERLALAQTQNNETPEATESKA
ncbi:DUF2986 domain-containing protein [Pseudoalteromonas tunicata]|uniref:Uncharacterized protein n=1 Tax=Pseudoalteromonas tunicata D2 TaxID=87626 RepID=A4CAP9_9GAMM|nr:DUF2986 domain-containing protein [Pseudoalteromonas tunicata]ATC95002.1 hypothetical protein PTUN_a2541 [Pseudoalteromonas tunicata]AXT30658.1 DUF2986 domain-containing protein [Pseudoalteromonas tunicata]EAR28457.1 hypothetical protein PTD2_21617 [Pseudoalteromonas tunicata D2]MDP4984710.1 DUF2986 domain-containing protein [Pseudoalteromonas tunicata]MDP5214082.1 DUF2986 domain-containing protein [Pseudoalteromonas tunicata]